jgi:hypothetical protein
MGLMVWKELRALPDPLAKQVRRASLERKVFWAQLAIREPSVLKASLDPLERLDQLARPELPVWLEKLVR